jgi:hypothetical protein
MSLSLFEQRFEFEREGQSDLLSKLPGKRWGTADQAAER